MNELRGAFLPAQDTAMADAWLTRYVQQAVALSLAEVAQGGIPFSALVVDPQEGLIGSGVNRVLAEQDRTAHAEIVALRNAERRCSSTGIAGIAGSTLIASGEPCGMCYVGALDAQVDTIIYAVGRDDAAQYGFDYRDSYRLLATRPSERWSSITVQAWPVEGGLGPFIAWSRRNRPE